MSAPRRLPSLVALSCLPPRTGTSVCSSSTQCVAARAPEADTARSCVQLVVEHLARVGVVGLDDQQPRVALPATARARSSCRRGTRRLAVGRRCRDARRRPRAARPVRTGATSCTRRLPVRSTAPACGDGASQACPPRAVGPSRRCVPTRTTIGVAVEHLHDAVRGVGRAPLLTEPPPRTEGGGQGDHDHGPGADHDAHGIAPGV